MRGCILVATLALAACSIDSTGLLQPDTGVPDDIRQVRDTGPLEDVPLSDTQTPDVPVIVDVGPGDVPTDIPMDIPEPTDVPIDVPLDTFDSGPVVGPDACEDPTLVACYLFDGDVLDSSPNARHLTAVGVDFEVMGAVGGAVVLGDASQLSLPGVDLGLGIDFTFELWYRMTEPIDNSDRRWGIVDGIVGTFAYRTNNSDVTRVLVNSQSRRPARNLPTEGWHHLVVVSNSGSARLTIDGELTEALGAASPGETTDLHVGSDSNRDPLLFEDSFIGNIDHLRIWNRPLSAPEVAALFP